MNINGEKNKNDSLRNGASIIRPKLEWSLIIVFGKISIDFGQISIDFGKISLPFDKISIDFGKISIDFGTSKKSQNERQRSPKPS